MRQRESLSSTAIREESVIPDFSFNSKMKISRKQGFANNQNTEYFSSY